MKKLGKKQCCMTSSMVVASACYCGSLCAALKVQFTTQNTSYML